MKRKHLIYIFFLFFTTICNGQSAGERFNYSIGIGLSNGFLASNSEINDWSGFGGRRLAIGGDLSFLVHFKAKPRLTIEFGLNLLSFKPLRFKYYSLQREELTGCPEFPINFRVDLNKKPQTWFANFGVTTSVYIWDGTYTSETAGSVFEPAITAHSQDFFTVNPLIEVGIGKRFIAKKGVMFEWLLSYKQGTRITSEHTLTRHDLNIVSKLRSRSSTLNLSLRFYLKKFKKDSETKDA